MRVRWRLLEIQNRGGMLLIGYGESEKIRKKETDREKVVQRMGERVNAEMPMQVLGSLMTSFLYMEDK